MQIPANAKAVIISPSIVGDRFVQLTPAYSGGQVLADGATLDQDRTAVPLELDQIYSSLDDLTVALGPNGANKKGALTDLLDTTARNFGGQGKKFHQTIEDFRQLSGTLADNKDQLFGSVRELEGFVRTLARNDHTVRSFNQTLAQVSGMLKGERGDLAASLHNLGIAMRQVSGFVARQPRDPRQEHRRSRRRSPRSWSSSGRRSRRRLRDAPLALNNLALTYNPQAGTLDTRANIGEIGHQIHVRPGDVPVRHPRPGQPGRPGVQRGPADPRKEPCRRARRRRRPAYDDTIGRTRASADSWRPADDPSPSLPQGRRRPGGGGAGC